MGSVAPTTLLERSQSYSNRFACVALLRSGVHNLSRVVVKKPV
ncbi:Unknown protein sequence [Pseudomonas syringae pv. maculicola]|nr:Unknown protein sequence [Pseudomonas syringae pv. maculicola]